VVEYPIIQDNCEAELREGMVFAVEQGVYPFDPEKGAEHITMCVRYEDQIMVTANACEFLSGPGKALYIVK
jgi:Xaa-Pro aminopeptidase